MKAFLANHATRWSHALIVVAPAVIVVDQASKSAAGVMSCGTALCAVSNEALFLGIGGQPVVPAVAIATLGLASFLIWIWMLSRRAMLSKAGVGLVVGGAVGNLVDRVVYSSVRDFLVGPFGVVFNGADIAIIVGLGLCLAGARPGSLLLKERR